MTNTMQNGRRTLPNVANTMQNAKWPCQNVVNTIQNESKWQVLVPNCCKYKAKCTKKESQNKSKTWGKKNTKNYSTPFLSVLYGLILSGATPIPQAESKRTYSNSMAGCRLRWKRRIDLAQLSGRFWRKGATQIGDQGGRCWLWSGPASDLHQRKRMDGLWVSEFMFLRSFGFWSFLIM